MCTHIVGYIYLVSVYTPFVERTLIDQTMSLLTFANRVGIVAELISVANDHVDAERSRMIVIM